MILTENEKSILNGGQGKGMQLAMELVVAVGDLFGAKRLLEVKKAHIDAAAYETLWDGGLDFLRYMADSGAKVSIPTTMNPLSRDVANWKDIGGSEYITSKSALVEDAYEKMGVLQTWTCASYQCTNIPRFGEIVSWSESNEVNFINSVLGARTERLPDLMDVCCALIARVPEFGLYITENRCGTKLFRLEGFGPDWFSDAVDYALLGYYVGKTIVNRVPVIEGLPSLTTEDDLKAFSAAAASSGSVGLFHAVGITPEAKTLQDAFQGKTDYPVHLVTPGALLAIREELNTSARETPDMILMGCPHCSVSELRKVAQYLDGKKVKEGVEFWMMTSQAQYTIAQRSGIAQALQDAGVTITRDTCLMLMGLYDRWREKTFVTNSAKVATYASVVNGAKIYMDTTKNCVEAAITGRISKGGAKW